MPGPDPFGDGYAQTGDEMHLRTARRFNGYVFTARLAAGEDDLSLLPFPHANFHLPEVCPETWARVTIDRFRHLALQTF